MQRNATDAMTTYRIRRAMPSGAKHLGRYSGRPGLAMATSLRRSWDEAGVWEGRGNRSDQKYKCRWEDLYIGQGIAKVREVVLLEPSGHARPMSHSHSGPGVCLAEVGPTCWTYVFLVLYMYIRTSNRSQSAVQAASSSEAASLFSVRSAESKSIKQSLRKYSIPASRIQFFCNPQS